MSEYKVSLLVGSSEPYATAGTTSVYKASDLARHSLFSQLVCPSYCLLVERLRIVLVLIRSFSRRRVIFPGKNGFIKIGFFF